MINSLIFFGETEKIHSFWVEGKKKKKIRNSEFINLKKVECARR
jgi:hypothetical protein